MDTACSSPARSRSERERYRDACEALALVAQSYRRFLASKKEPLREQAGAEGFVDEAGSV